MTLKIQINFFLSLLFLFSCNEIETPTISNGVSAYYEQEMYLYGSSENKYELRLSWNDYYECDYYDILIPTLNDYNQKVGPEIQTYHDIVNIDHNPGYYFTAFVNCSEELETDYIDSIIINTKEINPINNIKIHVSEGSYSDSLTFKHSTDLDIYKWYFYNFQFDQNLPSTHPYYFEHTHNDQSEWQQDIHPSGWQSEWPGYGGTNKLDYYKYTKANIDDHYCYMIKVEDQKGYSRNSHIICSDNYTRSLYSDPAEITSTTNNLRRRIVIQWEEYGGAKGKKFSGENTGIDFYQYIIWRSEDEDMPEESSEKIGVVIDKNQTNYYDRKNTSDGIKWYYKIETENQYGNSAFSSIKEGITRP